MRDFIDAIMNVLGLTSLTDIEFDTVTATFTLYEQATFDDISNILDSRAALPDSQTRLIAYYTAKGFTPGPNPVAASSIYIGSVLN